MAYLDTGAVRIDSNHIENLIRRGRWADVHGSLPAVSWLAQLPNGRASAFAEFDVELDGSNSLFV